MHFDFVFICRFFLHLYFCFVKFYCHHYKIHWFQYFFLPYNEKENYLFRLVGRLTCGSAVSVAGVAADSDGFALDCFGDLSSDLETSWSASPSLDASEPLTKVKSNFQMTSN